MNMSEHSASSSIIALQDLVGNSPAEFLELQLYMIDHLELLIRSWWVVFFLVLGIVMCRLICEWVWIRSKF